MIDIFDIIAFVVFGVLLGAVVVIVVLLGSLPGKLARKWDHPQASAVTVAGWLGVATGGILWPLALIWAFWIPSSAAALPFMRHLARLQGTDSCTPFSLRRGQHFGEDDNGAPLRPFFPRFRA
jgi:hypothetical protein